MHVIKRVSGRALGGIGLRLVVLMSLEYAAEVLNRRGLRVVETEGLDLLRNGLGVMVGTLSVGPVLCMILKHLAKHLVLFDSECARAICCDVGRMLLN